jgi:hypothetical protein
MKKIQTEQEAGQALVDYKERLNWPNKALIIGELEQKGQKVWRFFVPGQNRPLLLLQNAKIVEVTELLKAGVVYGYK